MFTREPKAYFVRFCFLAIAATAGSPTARATPVYLAPSSLYPSGHYAREFLVSRTAFERTQAWLRVRAPSGAIGWAPEDHLVTKDTNKSAGVFSPGFALKRDDVISTRDALPLRSAPLPFADIVAYVDWGAKLKRIASAELKWGKAAFRPSGESRWDGPVEVWWPMAKGFGEDGAKAARLQAETLTTVELFKRKLYDLAVSPTRPESQIASAEGVFRSVDGKLWRRVAEFKNGNFPVAIARSGAIFVGPYASDDDGESFHQFVKWDALMAALKRAFDAGPESVQVVDVRPLDRDGQRLRLKLALGFGEPVIALTADRGLTWEARSAAPAAPRVFNGAVADGREILLLRR